MTGTGSARPAPGPIRSRRPTVVAAAVLVFAALCFTPPGARVVAACHWFLDFYGGVFSLVALSLTVMGGLAATDRLILLIRHRVLLQALHRATAAAATGFLVVHIAMKVISGHARLLDVAVPFLAHHRAGYVGLGTIAAYLMGIAAWSGVSRGRFAGISRPSLWRILHSAAYAAWPIAILHGLASGRSAKGWVTASYAICLVAVGLALAVRLSVHWGRKRVPIGSTTGSLPRVGAPARPLAVPLLTSGPPRVEPVSPAVTITANAPRVYDPSLVGPVDYAARHTSGPPASERTPERTPAPAAPRRNRPAETLGSEGRRARRRAADTAPPAARTFESIPDDEFWAFMRGERP